MPSLRLGTLFALILGGFLTGSTSWPTTPLVPPALPLVVKSPYLNSWQSAGTGESTFPLTIAVPAFWPAWDDQTMWTLVVIVDESPYKLMGAGLVDSPPGSNMTLANQTNIVYTPTRTTFSFSMGPVDVNVTFFSPVTPKDLMRQSLPFAYLYLDLSATDGMAHDVRIYSDITLQWLHGGEVLIPDPGPKVAANASLIDSSDFIGLQMQLQDPLPFVEIAERAQDAIGIFAMKFDSVVKYQVGTDEIVRAIGFNSTGLQNTIDANYSTHALDNPFDAFAITLDLGAIHSTPEPIVFTVGMVRDPSIRVTTASGATQMRSSFYWSNFTTIPDAISFVLDDFNTTLAGADAFDEMIHNNSLSSVPGYSDLVALATRQVFGTLEITLSKTTDGTWNYSDIMIFTKDMGDVGSTGTSGGTNVVDVLYAGLPALLFLNPQLGQYVLRPILESQVASNGTFIAGNRTYAPRHIGNQFPNASSDVLPHNLGIEQSGNMLIMVLAHLQATNDSSIVQTYHTLLKSWANYLVDETLNAGFQTTSVSDGITSFNQTNLVLKGIIGIYSMSFISQALDEGDDQLAYQVWLDNAFSPDRSRLLSSFEDQTSGGLIYNLYADKLLGLHLIPSNISIIQSEYYKSLLSAYGLPLDNKNPSLSRLDWTMFSVASVLEDGGSNAPVVFQQTISSLVGYVTSQTNTSPLAIVYNPQNGDPFAGSNSFAAGSIFAPLLMGGNLSGNDPSGQTPANHKISPTLAGAIGGGFALTMLIAFIFVWSRRHSRKPGLYHWGFACFRCRSANTELPQDENLIIPFVIPEDSDILSDESTLVINGKLSKSSKSTAETTDTPSNSVITSRPLAVEETDGRLADLVSRMVRNEIRTRRVRNEIRNRRVLNLQADGVSEVLPSYLSAAM